MIRLHLLSEPKSLLCLTEYRSHFNGSDIRCNKQLRSMSPELQSSTVNARLVFTRVHGFIFSMYFTVYLHNCISLFKSSF